MSLFNDKQLLRLTTAVLGGIALLALAWGLYFVAVNPHSLLARPVIIIDWWFDHDAIAKVQVYRADADWDTICWDVAAADYHELPSRHFSLSKGTSQPSGASRYRLQDNYRMARGDLFCYKIVGTTSEGPTATLYRHRAATVSYYWQMIVNGLLVTALSVVLLILARRLLQLSSRLDKLIPLGQ